MSDLVDAPRRRVELFDISIDCVTMDETVAIARRYADSGVPHQHVAVNAAKVVALGHDDGLRDIVAGCDLVNADGASVVMASRVLGKALPERVAGIDLFLRLVASAHEDGKSIYLLGATDEVVARVVEIFREDFPGLRIAGFRNGFWDDDHALVEQIRALRPSYLFLAIPSPHKEVWLNTHLERLGVPFVMGVGGSFDVVAGKVGRAPRWVQRVGLEWAWRCGQEPRRLWRRYLVGNSAYVGVVAREWYRNRR